MQLLNHMALFVEIVRARSFRRAAETLDMPVSTLSRKLAELEKSLGLRLLHRTTRRLELTDAGKLYYDRCHGIVEEAHIIHKQLGLLLIQPEGLLRVSLPVDFGMLYLAPLLKGFITTYPGITLDMDLTPRNVDLVTEPYDLAIRMGNLPDSGLIARKLLTLPRYLYASADYLTRYGIPRIPAELADHHCLIMRIEKGNQWHLRQATQTVTMTVSGKMKMNSVGMLKQLAIQGAGIALLAEKLVREEVRTQQLVQVLADWTVDPIDVWAITETRLLPARVQVFLDFIKTQLM